MKTLLTILLLSLFVASAQSEFVLPNGNFEEADPTNPRKPAGWDLPDGLAVQWVTVPDRGKVIRMDTTLPETVVVESYQKAGLTDWVFPNPQKNAIAETYGLSLYSDAIAVKVGKAYRVSFDFMSEKGTKGKLWFRGYGDLGGKNKKLFDSVIECDSKGGWQTFSGVCHPSKRPNVTQFKVMLFVYYPAGISWFDNVKVEEIDEAPAQ